MQNQGTGVHDRSQLQLDETACTCFEVHRIHTVVECQHTAGAWTRQAHQAKSNMFLSLVGQYLFAVIPRSYSVVKKLTSSPPSFFYPVLSLAPDHHMIACVRLFLLRRISSSCLVFIGGSIQCNCSKAQRSVRAQLPPPFFVVDRGGWWW